MDTPQLISITNGAGILFLSVCCAAICFMGWFFVSLTREQRSGPVRWRMQVKVRSAAWQPRKKKEQAQQFETPFPAASLRVPIDLGLSGSANRGPFPVDIVPANTRKWRGLRAGS